MKYTLVSIFQILLILINCQTLTKQDTTIDDKPKEINKSLSKDKKKEIRYNRTIDEVYTQAKKIELTLSSIYNNIPTN